MVINRCYLCMLDGESIDHLLLQLLRVTLGYTLQGRGFICLLVDRRALSKCGCVEDDSFMSFVVLMEREKCEMF